MDICYKSGMRLIPLNHSLWLLVIVASSCAATAVLAQSFSVCHGYGCVFHTKVALTGGEQAKIASIMAGGRGSAAAERAAIRRAVQVFEDRTTQVIGAADRPKMEFGKSHEKGQMDCVDESTNTDHFLRYLQDADLLHYHVPTRRDSRGSFLDGRYPHFTAVLRDNSGTLWAVDSWYEPAGGPPDIMVLAEWHRHGHNGQR